MAKVSSNNVATKKDPAKWARAKAKAKAKMGEYKPHAGAVKKASFEIQKVHNQKANKGNTK